MSLKIKYTAFQNILIWLLVTAGAIKPFFIYIDAPFDWTLVVFSIVLLDIIFNIIVCPHQIHLNKEKLLILVVLVLFYFLILLSLIYTPSVKFSIEKSYLFSINILFFLYPLFVRKLDLKFQYTMFLYILLPLVIWFILFKTLYFSSLNSGYSIVNIRFYEIRRNYLGFGMCLSILTILQIHLKKSYLIGLFSIILLFGLGSRGALIFLLIIIILWKWKSVINKILCFKLKKKVFRTLVPFSMLFPIILVTQYDKIFSFMYLGLIRFQSLFEVSTDNSVLGRIERIAFALENVFSSAVPFLFGNGIGSFGILYSGEDIREYPHNIFLEILFELGIFGLFLFCLFLFLPFLFKRQLIFKILLSYFFLNALKSGDLVGLWLLFFFVGLLVFNPKIFNETTI